MIAAGSVNLLLGESLLQMIQLLHYVEAINLSVLTKFFFLCSLFTGLLIILSLFYMCDLLYMLVIHIYGDET